MDRPSISSDAASTFSGSTACSYKDAPPTVEAKAARRGMRQRVRDVVHELGRPPTAKQDAKDGKTTKNHVDMGPAGSVDQNVCSKIGAAQMSLLTPHLINPSHLASKIPSELRLKEAATVPVNLVTIAHSATADLNLELSQPI
ncbi:hypothetical protein BGZ61DRAFT_582143 [Ilyonectria robusta]|uniref:uncharacterized protein n=1 Tax=Ilyonectria robusta TaxID=1079257 RepID=UPI001E8D03FD|nr:uncharacterized protein BGZ61DRAFT_582143 [Ilyonectria robusta]KAH8736866.1 hypothetical protein BGZ61DRAFT_582143 [Ilyonectria robusta]